MSVIVDYDDLTNECMDQLSHILRLKETYPNFKVTIFTIPLKCSDKFLGRLQRYSEWVELAIHGLRHHSFEFSSKTYDECGKILEQFNRGFFVRGFKGPQWRLSQDCVQWCHDNKFWVGVVDPLSKETKLFKGQKFYAPKYARLRGYDAFHSHINWVSKGVTAKNDYPVLVKKWNRDETFIFASEAVQSFYPRKDATFVD